MTDTSPALELQPQVTATPPVTQFDAGRVEILESLRCEGNEGFFRYLYEHVLLSSENDFKSIVGQLKWRKAIDELGGEDIALGLKREPSEEEKRNIRRQLAQDEQPTGTTVRVWPSLLVASWNYRKASGALRLYFLARTLDPSGSGVVASVDLWQAAKELKVNRRTFDTWKADALRLGIFKRLNEWTLRVVSQDKVFKLLNCQNIDKATAIISLKSLFSKGWRACVWAAYLKANHDEKPISQKKLQELTGVSVSAQKNSLHKHYKSKRQYGITSQPAEMVSVFNEFTSPGKAFVFRDPQQGNCEVTAINLPSIKRVSNKTAKIAGAGRRIAILARLTRYGLGCINRPLSNFLQPNKTITRLFYSTPKQQKIASRLTQAMSRLPNDPDRVFVKRGRHNAWDVYPLQDGNFFLS